MVVFLKSSSVTQRVDDDADLIISTLNVIHSTATLLVTCYLLLISMQNEIVLIEYLILAIVFPRQ